MFKSSFAPSHPLINHSSSFSTIPLSTVKEADCYWKNKELKETVKRLKVTFSSKGGVGELQLRSHWKAGEEFRKGSVAENVQVPATMEHLFPKGRVFILPSFFHMLLKLQRRKQRFVLIFRTFGVDWSEIQQEMELFCTGEHPFYPFARFDGSSGTVRTFFVPASSIFF